jgi:hypothetical protein
VHQILNVALAIYAALAVAIWMTIDNIPIAIPLADEPVRTTLRHLTLAILGLFAALTVLHWKLDQVKARREQNEFKG